MRYLVITNGDWLAARLSAELSGADNAVLAIDRPDAVTMAETAAFAPDVFVIRMPPWWEPERRDAMRGMLDLATLANRPVIALLPWQEFVDFGRPAGVDEVLTQPYTVEALQNLVRLLMPMIDEDELNEVDEPVRICGSVAVDSRARAVYVESQEISVTPPEFSILYQLCRMPGRVLTRAVLVRCLPYNSRLDHNERAVDVHITRLRRKLAHAPGFRIATVRYVGYRADSGQAPSDAEHGVAETVHVS